MSIFDEKIFLKNTIEQLRTEMIRVGMAEGLTSNKTIMISQKLDRYIAIYQSLKQRKIFELCIINKRNNDGHQNSNYNNKTSK